MIDKIDEAIPAKDIEKCELWLKDCADVNMGFIEEITTALTCLSEFKKLQAEVVCLNAIVKDAEDLLIDIHRLDKTPEYDYGKREEDRDNCGKLAGVGKRWLTPKELIKKYFWRTKRDIYELSRISQGNEKECPI